MRKYFSKQQFFTSAAAVLLSVLTVAVVTYGASIIDTASVGSGTSTPGAALGVKGAGIFEDFVQAGAFRSTTTDTSWIMGGNFGLGTTTPGAKLAVRGEALFDGRVTASSYAATSTTATSTMKWGFDIASSSLQVDGVTGRVAIGTTTFPLAGVAGTMSVEPSLTIGAVGGSDGATSTLFIAGEGQKGGQIILTSSDGTRCGSIVFDSEGVAEGLTGGALIVEVVDCPK